MIRLLSLLSVLLVLTAALAQAETIRVEAETYVASGDAGGTAVRAVSCSAASQGHAVDGMDAPGDWIELRFELPYAACVEASLRSAGITGLVRNVDVQFTPDPPVTSGGGESLTTPAGLGIT